MPEGKLPYVDENDWRAYWLHGRRKLPAHFEHLRDLAAMAQQVVPGGLGDPAEMARHYAPEGLYLEPGRRLSEESVEMQVCYGKDLNPVSKVWYASSLPERTVRESSSRYFGADLRLREESQNEAIIEAKDLEVRQLQSIRYTANETRPIGALTPALLVDHFERRMDQLAARAHQLYFEYSLFFAGRLPRALQTRPGLADELNSFFTRTHQHFDDRIRTATGKQESTRAAVFMLQQQTRFLSYCLNCGIPVVENVPTVQRLANMRLLLQERLRDPDFQQEEVLAQIHLTLMDSYQVQPLSGLEDVELLTSSLASVQRTFLQNSAVLEQIPPATRASATSVPIQQAVALRALLREDPQGAKRILDRILYVYDLIPHENAMWSEVSFPLYECRLDANSTVQVNLLTGDVCRNGQPLQHSHPPHRRMEQLKCLEFDGNTRGILACRC